MLVRYIGAYGHGKSLAEALEFEANTTAEVCACEFGEIEHASVCLLMKRTSIIRRFRGDVWSVRQNDGTLKATRKAVKSHHEFWCKGGKDSIRGVIVTDNIPAEMFATIRDFCAKYNLKFWRMRDNNGWNWRQNFNKIKCWQRA